MPIFTIVRETEYYGMPIQKLTQVDAEGVLEAIAIHIEETKDKANTEHPEHIEFTVTTPGFRTLYVDFQWNPQSPPGQPTVIIQIR